MSDAASVQAQGQEDEGKGVTEGVGAQVGRLSSRGLDGTVSVTVSRVQPLVEDFAGSWKGKIDAINLHVMGSFHNMKTGMEILKRWL